MENINRAVVFYPKDEIMQAVKRYDTPFFLYDENIIRNNCQNLIRAFSSRFNNFEPLFAVKANPNPNILKILKEEGFGLDCSSPSESYLARQLNMGGMYTGNYTPTEELLGAKESGLILNLDDASMIEKLNEIGVPNILSFRVNPGPGKEGVESLIFSGSEAKYGINHEEIALAYKQAQGLGVKHFGIHMMTGSNVLDESYFPQIVERLFEIVRNIRESVGIEIEFMNIGGGFGVAYHPGEKSLNIGKIAQDIRGVFDRNCVEGDILEPRLMIEPGRYVVANAGWLITHVEVIKQGYKRFVGVDASSNDMPRPAIYDVYHHISVINNETDQEIVSVVGKLCENSDQFAKDRYLPRCNVGDVVVIHNCGGHAYAMGHNYNGRVRHGEYLINVNGDFSQIRRAETIEDLFRTIVFNN